MLAQHSILANAACLNPRLRTAIWNNSPEWISSFTVLSVFSMDSYLRNRNKNKSNNNICDNPQEKGALLKTMTSNFRYRMYLKFNVARFGKKTFPRGLSHIVINRWRRQCNNQSYRTFWYLSLSSTRIKHRINFLKKMKKWKTNQKYWMRDGIDFQRSSL